MCSNEKSESKMSGKQREKREPRVSEPLLREMVVMVVTEYRNTTEMQKECECRNDAAVETSYMRHSETPSVCSSMAENNLVSKAQASVQEIKRCGQSRVPVQVQET